QPHQLPDVVKRPLVAVEVATGPLAAARPTAVEPIDLHALVAEIGCRLGEPAGVAGDAVEEDDDRRRLRRPAAPAEVVEPHAVSGREESALGVSAGRINHGSSVECHPARGQRRGRPGPAAQPAASRTMVRWPPRSRAPSPLAPARGANAGAPRGRAPQPAASRTMVRWPPRSRAPSPLAIVAVIVSPALR